MKKPRISFERREYEWQGRAIAAAFAAVQKLIKSGKLSDGVFPPSTPIGYLDDTDWDKIIAAAVFAWFSVRSELAFTEKFGAADMLTGLAPDPKEFGLVLAVLPQLAEMPGVDWAKPLGEWPREDVARFLLAGHQLIKSVALR